MNKPNGRSGLHLSVVWNLAGQVIPLATGLITIPFLVKGYGAESFGLLTLAWVLVGYAGILDLGLSRALTQAVASELSSGGLNVARIVRTALLIILVLGLVLGGTLAIVLPSLGSEVLELSTDLRGEAASVFRLIAYAVPLLVLSQGFRGVLEAYLRFDLVNLARIPLGLMSFVGPLFLLLFSASVVPAVVVLITMRVIAGMFYARQCHDLIPDLFKSVSLAPDKFVHLIRHGGWMTVSNVVGPILVHFDRFLIGAVISVSATAYYSIPFDMVTRLSLLGGSLAGVMFPAFAVANQEPSRLRFLFERGTTYAFVMTAPLIFVVFIFTPEFLSMWLSPDFALESSAPMRILSLGVMINSVALVAFMLLQGRGRSDLTAKFHLIETPFYIALLWWSVGHFGIVGAAASWTLRVVFDSCFLVWGAMRVAPLSYHYLMRGVAAFAVTAVAVLIISELQNTTLRITITCAVLAVFALAFRSNLAAALEGVLPRDTRRRILAGLLK